MGLNQLSLTFKVTYTGSYLSITGKKLVAKLKALQSENEELGRQLRQGRVEQYEVEISLQRKMINELKASLEGELTLNWLSFA